MTNMQIEEMLDLKNRLIKFGWFTFETLSFQAKTNIIAADLLEYEMNKDCVGYEKMKSILN